MDSVNKSESSPTPAQKRPQTPPRKVSSQAKLPTTPPNSYILSPPGAPRALPFRLSASILTGKNRPSTLRRIHSRPSNRLVGTGARLDSESAKNSRSRSPARNRLVSYRSRSPVRNHHRVKKSVEVTSEPSITRPGSQSHLLINDQPFNGVEIGARYWNMLSLADPEHVQGMAGTTSMVNGDNADVKSPEQNLDDFYKMGQVFHYDKLDTK